MQKKITRQTQYRDQFAILLYSRILADQKSNKNKFENTNTLDLRKKDSKKHSPAPQYFLNSKGSALVTGLTLFPLIIGSLLATFVICWMIRAKNDLLFTCEQGLLRTQNLLVEAENQLLGLNSPIEKIVVQKKFLKKALLASKTPYEASLIKAKLLLIEIELLALKNRQQVIISTTNFKAQQDIFLTTQKIKNQLHQLQSQWSAYLLSSVVATSPRIQLHSQKMDPSADIYMTFPGFSKQQTLQLTLQLKGTRLFPSWLQYLKEKKFFWQDSCSSRPAKKENGLWIAEIGTGIL